MHTIELSAAELAQRLGGELEGDGGRVLRRVDTLEQAETDSVSWLGSPRYLPQMVASRAGVVLVRQDCVAPPGFTLIRVADPDSSLCNVLELFGPHAERVSAGVHPTAVVDPTARVAAAAIGPHVVIGAEAVIGAGTQLHAGVCVGRESIIGRDCVIWPHVVVRERVTLGDRVIIHPNATIGADGFGYVFRNGRHRKIPQIGVVVIEDDVEIGANSAVDRAKTGATRIARGTKIDNLVQIAHNVEIGEDCIILAQSAIGGSSRLGRRVLLAGRAAVTDHVAIGEGAQIAGQAAVLKNVAPGELWRGAPAEPIRAYHRWMAACRKAPAMLRNIRELAKRVARLESTADDWKRS